ncbi:MAG TPA: HEAT repeat domain-containing protein, partial [Ktedonobacteraceae bacterium]
MEYRDHEQDDAGQVAVSASLLPSVLRRLGLDGPPTTHSEEQIAALRDEERHQRGTALLEVCATALRDPAWEVRAAAVWALGTLGELAPAEALLNALSDEDGSVRAAALRTLYRIRGRVPLESTLRLLRDADWQVREAVELTVEELGEQPQFYKEMETHLMAQTP